MFDILGVANLKIATQLTPPTSLSSGLGNAIRTEKLPLAGSIS